MKSSIASGSRILYFFLYPGVVQHAKTELALIEHLTQLGVKIDVLRCRGFITSPCVVKESIHGPDRTLNQWRDDVTCNFCMRMGVRIPESENIKHFFIEDLLSTEELSSSQILARRVDESSWSGFYYSNLPLGRFAAYVPLIRSKATSATDIRSVWSRYVYELETCINVERSIRKLVAQNKYDLALVFGGLYGPERTFHQALKNAGVPTVILDGSVLSQELHSTIHGFSTDNKWMDAVSSMEWVTERHHPLTSRSATAAVRHHSSLVDSSSPFVYSRPRNTSLRAPDIYSALRIPLNAQVILFLVSSPDEEVSREQSGTESPSGREDFVSSQKRAVEQLQRYAEQHPEIYVVIRLHPRLFKAKRSHTKSPALEYFEGLESQVRENIRVDAPSNGLSLYDLAQVASVAVTHLSTSALEFLAFGLPVVVTNRQFNTCPLDLVDISEDRSDASLFATLNQAVATGPDFERARSLFRWWGFLSRFNRVLQVEPDDPTVIEVKNLKAKQPTKNISELLSGIRLRSKTIFNSKLLQSITGELWMLKCLTVSRLTKRRSASHQLNDVLYLISSGQNSVAPDLPISLEEETTAIQNHLIRMLQILEVDPTSESKLGQFYRDLVNLCNRA